MDIRQENEVSVGKRKFGTNCSWTKKFEWNELEAWLQGVPIVFKYVLTYIRNWKNWKTKPAQPQWTEKFPFPANRLNVYKVHEVVI
jgi:hypothetical protein